MKKLLLILPLLFVLSSCETITEMDKRLNIKSYTLVREAPCLPEFIIFYDEVQKYNVIYYARKAKHDQISKFTCQQVKISLPQKYYDIIIKDTVGIQQMRYTPYTFEKQD